MSSTNEHTRTCTFVFDPKHIDEKVLDASGHCNLHYDHSSPQQPSSPSHSPPAHLLRRTKIFHRDLASLSLIATHTRTQFGYHGTHPAALLSFRFQFLGSNSTTHAQRFSKADIRISFSPASTVVVADFGPKHLQSSGTEGQRN